MNKANSGHLEGLTDNYLKVLVPGDEALEGTIQMTELSMIEGEYIIGKIITES